VIGIIGLGLLQSVVGLQASILLCAVLFILAIVICLGVDQARGQQAARDWEARDREASTGDAGPEASLAR
jgi:UMF1 family MFS transporter